MTDYIRRDEALSFPFANGKYDNKHANKHFIYGCESYKEWLKGLPAADVRENVHGVWIEETDRYNHWHCSHCGYVIGLLKMDAKYCPHCGSQMNWRKLKMGVIVKTLLMPERCSNCFFCEMAIDPLSGRRRLAHCSAAMLELSPDDIENGRPDECPLCEYRGDEP